MSLVSAAISRFASGIVGLIRDTSAQMKAERDVGSYRAQDVFSGFVQGTGGAQGAGVSGDFVGANLGTTLTVYLHFKLPLKNTDHLQMFHIHLQGYNYGQSKVVDVTWSALIDNGTLGNKSCKGTHPVELYFDSNGNVVASIFFENLYFTTVHMTAFSPDETKRIRRGQVQNKFATTAQVTF